MNGLVLKRPVLPKDLKVDRRIARFLRSAVRDDRVRRYCGIAILTVGEEGRMSRPRPVELAVAFDDGTAVSTVVNPQRDMANARQAYGITVSDVLLAPTLREAWAVIAPMLAGYTPVGFGIDETLGLIDFELKRLGHVTAMPLGINVSGASGPAPTALEGARAALEAHARSSVDDGGASAFDEPEPSESVSGLLVSRDDDAPTPAADHLPGLSAILRVSRDVSAIVLRGMSAQEVQGPAETPWIAAARQSVADQLCAAASQAKLTDVVVERLQEAGKLLGVDIVSGACKLERHDIGAVLVAGARICFTGTAQDTAGRVVEREEMERLAQKAGLAPVKSVTKTRCEVLVTAEAGSQSGKARKAQEYGKPVFSADEFFAWLAGKDVVDAATKAGITHFTT
jgi:ATP-dependent DNA helicase PIF1